MTNQQTQLKEKITAIVVEIIQMPRGKTVSEDTYVKRIAEALLEAGPEDKDMERFETTGKDGGIDTTIFDSDEDPRGAKNGETLAHLAQFASDTGFNNANDDWRTLIRSIGGLDVK